MAFRADPVLFGSPPPSDADVAAPLSGMTGVKVVFISQRFLDFAARRLDSERLAREE